MTEENYSKREIDMLHEGLHEKLDTIIEKQDFTNGKVRKIIVALILIFGILLGAGSKYVPILLGVLL